MDAGSKWKQRTIRRRAVLVAIAIPIFNSQLEKSRESTDIANARDYYAQVSVGLLDGSLEKANDTMTVADGVQAKLTAVTAADTTTDGSIKVTVTGVKVQQAVFGAWSISDHNVAGADVDAPSNGDNTLIYTFKIEKGTYTTYLETIEYSH